MTNTPWKPNRPIVAGFFLAAAAGLLSIIILNILLNAPSESALVLGLSLDRLALLSGMLILFGGLAYLGLQTLMGKWFKFTASEPAEKPSRRMDLILLATLLVFACAWLMTWTPAERFGQFYYYIVRVYPFIVWLMCVSGLGLILLLAQRFGVYSIKAFLGTQRISFLVAGAAVLIFGLISWVVSFRVVNMRWQDEDFWYGAGVPLLPFQVLLAVAASVALVMIANRFPAIKDFGKKHRLDVILFVLVWIAAAWLWAKEPVNPDFFITKQVAPNFELYPDYDAKSFDMMSQFALIGQGLNNGQFYDRSLYPAILVLLHVFGGQNYAQVVALQAALFAVFPALAYLLGRRLHSRAAGAGLAILFTLRGINAMQVGPVIDTAHQKQMLTDFPTAILMLILAVLLVRWLQQPGKNWPSLGLAAGVTGLATLFRPHPLIYLPILITLAIWVYRQKPRVWITFSGLILVAALAGILPWIINNGQGKSVIDFYLVRVKQVIQERYPNLQPPPGSRLPGSKEVAAVDNARFHFSGLAASLPDKSVLAFSVDNFLNNLTTSVQGLPSTPYYQDLQYTVRKSENFWKPYWDGSMSPWARIMLPINLVLVALGLGAAWKRARFSGLIPLMVMLAYYTMDGLARTSGGRYLVPVDWVVILYYFLGILALIEIAGAFFRQDLFVQAETAREGQPDIALNRAAWARILGVVFLFTIIGVFIPLSGSFFERRYRPLTQKALAGQVSAVAPQELGKFLATPGAVILQGRILYPRQMEKDEGLDVSIYNYYHTKPYPRMVMNLLGPNGQTPQVFPTLHAVSIPNASDAIILGCRESDYVQVWGIFLPGSHTLVKRTPATPLVCPLPEPVCDNNHNCK